MQSDLKGLNSLNRNINGLMNSNDPKMDGFRAFVEASAAQAAAEEALEDVLAENAPVLDSYGALLAGLGYEAPATAQDYQALADRLNEQANAAEPSIDDFTDENGVVDQSAYDDAVTQWSADTVAASAALEDFDEAFSAFNAVEAAQAAVEEGADAVSDDALMQAIVDGLNATGAGPVTADDITPAMFDRVSALMGIGEDQDGLIDDYLARQGNDAEGDAEDLADVPLEDPSGPDAPVEES